MIFIIGYLRLLLAPGLSTLDLSLNLAESKTEGGGGGRVVKFVITTFKYLSFSTKGNIWLADKINLYLRLSKIKIFSHILCWPYPHKDERMSD